ncbi:MAG TPA: aminotransferase class V-fold PLP-dependent enzyme [Methanospirillum sp.]|uniref:aminotransferase class V-fold PLP-dependent enzyme n=1 Tax=Methanospirillum sp. TaxID=45200 RepID=UPI002BB9AE4D|nr:aminotransferase class V-fold PLP-dependent enzyme [Methanospirillum sp.]HOJ96825.1 aminotransferase class V-fold PLP-dependent enzyme [Methanospirillum sp.]HOL41800.1 aminotransferase class V-fold PLP-dependent enzyme [Methanospirillum sp.]HPP77248.1 aminotransferase class V-fold PLP-dependent enzyme [Methanospirillum sp.]
MDKNNSSQNSHDIIYANNAATTWPKPESVLKAVCCASAGPYSEQGRTTLREIPDYLFDARKKLAELFNSKESEAYVFTANATDSLNLLIHGFAAHEQESFHVITTEFEHNSVIRPLYELQKAGKITVTVIAPDRGGHINPDDVISSCQKNTKLGIISHAGNVIGTVQNINEISRILHDEEIFSIIDGAQSAGQIPIDLSRVCCDAFVFTGHKYLFGIPGTGGFYLKTPEKIHPVRQGGTGFDSSSPTQPDDMPERFETGTPNFPGIAGLAAGITFIRDIGVETIHSKGMALISDIVHELHEIEGVSLLHDAPETPLISFQIAGIKPDDIGYMLAKAFRIITRSGLHCAPWIHNRLTQGRGAVRVSLSYMNTPNECEQIIDGIRAVCASIQ